MAKKKSDVRLEQEALILGVTKRCRGVYLVDADTQTKNFEAWRAIEDAGKEKPALAMIDELVEAANEHAPKGFVVSARPVVEGSWDSLRRAALPLIRLRGDKVGQGCGWDLNEEIIKHPFDGAEHMTECPNCGHDISWKAPVFDAA